MTGEIVEISREGIKSKCIVPRPEAKLPAFCIFEYVYFARPDSIMEGWYFFKKEAYMCCHKDFFWLLLSVDERLQDFHFDTHFLLRGVGGEAN